MSTNKINLRTVEEFMSDYSPIYKPIYTTALLGKSQQYDAVAAKREFRRVEAVGDIRNKRQLPKQTDIHQISVLEGKKAFKAYFLASQYVQSQLQDTQGIEEILQQVLDEHQRQADELFLLGEGASNGTQLNNGLFYSSDANKRLQSNYQIPSSGRLKAFHTKVVEQAAIANQVAGRKAIYLYGSVKPLFNSLHEMTDTPVKTVLSSVLGSDFSFVEIPDDVTPSGQNGFIIQNYDQTKLHYTLFPGLLDQGVDARRMETWHNFLLGSMMLEVLAKDGVVHQPTTLE